MFYYAKYIGVRLDYDKYRYWLSQNPLHKVPVIFPDDDNDSTEAQKAYSEAGASTGTENSEPVTVIASSEKEAKDPASEDIISPKKEEMEPETAVASSEKEDKGPASEETEPATAVASSEKEDKGPASEETVSPKKDETEPTSTTAEPGPIPEWQKAAPIVDLYVKKDSVAASERPEVPSYPGGFAEMLKLIQEGKPVPGIREIPNTVIRDPVSPEFEFPSSARNSISHVNPSLSSQSAKRSFHESLGRRTMRLTLTRMRPWRLRPPWTLNSLHWISKSK